MRPGHPGSKFSRVDLAEGNCPLKPQSRGSPVLWHLAPLCGDLGDIRTFVDLSPKDFVGKGKQNLDKWEDFSFVKEKMLMTFLSNFSLLVTFNESFSFFGDLPCARALLRLPLIFTLTLQSRPILRMWL